MAEPKRVEFKTISTANGDKADKKRTLTHRFVLSLPESTASTCPEFSFTELVKKEKGGSDDPFGDEDNHDEIAALAKKFEEKYGPKPRKKIKCLNDDDFDLGEGYDENDPFIDNTEAYDEVVPRCLTTVHGGFYINRGTLDFKTLSDHENSDDEFASSSIRKRGRPKKILESGSEQEEDNEQKKKKLKRKRLKEGIEGEKRKRKKVSLGLDGEKIKKRKTLDPERKKKTSPTVAELLKQQTASTSTTTAVTNGNADEEMHNILLQNPDHHATDKLAVQAKSEQAMSDSPQDDLCEDRKSDSPGTVNHLPTGLPPSLASTIDSIKQAARETKEGKCKFFSGNVNKMLLDIELASRQLACGHRSLIYAHLADHLPCGKETLIKRAKKLRENQQDDQLKVPIQRLKDAINEIMPGLQEQHEQDVQKARMENKEKGEDMDLAKDEAGNTESDDEEKANVTGNGEKPSKKGNRGPRKIFKWTPEIRKLLCSIVSIKMQMFETFRIRNQTAEEYLKTFLENEVKLLWPQGWMQTRMLFKESRSVHGKWTNPQKPKKSVLMTKSAQSPQPLASVSVENMVENKVLKTSETVSNMVCDVIELSDNDEQMPLVGQNKDTKMCTIPATIDIPPMHFMPRPTDILNTSPNTLQAAAAATAAAVVAAVSVPKLEVQSSVGDRIPRETLVTEILKGTLPSPVNFPLSGKSQLAHGAPPSSAVRSSDAVVHPSESFLAAYDRFLTGTGNGSQLSPSSKQQQLTSLQKVQMKQQQKKQLQSKVVSSSMGKQDLGNDRSKQTVPVQWHMDNLLMDDKVHKGTSAISDSPPNHLSASRTATSTSTSTVPHASVSQPANYKKMYSLLKGSESLDALPTSKTDLVQQQIISQILAEQEAAKNLKWAGKSGEDHSKKSLSGVVSHHTPKLPTPAVVLSRQLPSTSSTVSLMSPPSTSQRQAQSSGSALHSVSGSVRAGGAQMSSLSLLPPTDVSSSVIKSQDNGKHKTAASVRSQQQHSPTTSVSLAVMQNCSSNNSVSSPSELLTKKGSPMSVSSGPNLPQVSLQRIFSPGLLSPNSSQSQHCNKPSAGHVSPSSRTTGMLSSHPSQNQRAFLSPGQNLQNQKSLMAGQTGHGAEVAHRLSASPSTQQEGDAKLGSGSSLAGTADGKVQKADVAQRLFENKVKPKATALDMKNKFRIDQHFFDLQRDILIESHKKMHDSRASEHAAQAFTAGATSSSKRTSSSGMHGQWPTTKNSVSPTVIPPSSTSKAAGRIVKSDSMQTSSAGLSSVAAHIQNTDSALPKPAHMGTLKPAGQVKTNPPPAHVGIVSQGQTKAHQAAVAAAFFNRQQAGLPTAHLSHAFTRPPFEDSSSVPSDNK